MNLRLLNCELLVADCSRPFDPATANARSPNVLHSVRGTKRRCWSSLRIAYIQYTQPVNFHLLAIVCCLVDLQTRSHRNRQALHDGVVCLRQGDVEPRCIGRELACNHGKNAMTVTVVITKMVTTIVLMMMIMMKIMVMMMIIIIIMTMTMVIVMIVMLMMVTIMMVMMMIMMMKMAKMVMIIMMIMITIGSLSPTFDIARQVARIER